MLYGLKINSNRLMLVRTMMTTAQTKTGEEATKSAAKRSNTAACADPQAAYAG